MGILGIRLKPRRVALTGDPSPAATLRRYVWRMTGWHQAGACLLALAVAALNLVPLELQRRIVDDAITARNLDLLLWLGGFYVGAFLLLRAAKLALNLYQSWLSESTVRYSRRHLLGIYRSPDRAEVARRPGEAVSVIGSETDKLGAFVGAGISQACANTGMLLGVIGYMLVVQTGIALFALAALLPQALITPMMQGRLNRLTEERLALLRAFGDKVAAEEASTGAPTLRQVNRIYGNQMRFYIWKFLLKALLNLLNGAGPIIVMVFGGWLAIRGETTVGVLVAFVSGFERLSNPVHELIGFYRQAESARVQHRMIAAWMTAGPGPDRERPTRA